ncbi:MAG: hypothetical protein GY714_19990 [Desulfobacterales bacterium]|nr:hypothetical protein [Desulfobacterales bacterium]
MKKPCGGCEILYIFKRSGVNKNPCPYAEEGYFCKDNNYKFFRSKKVDPTYKLTEKYKDGFSLVDIAREKLCWDEFIKLMEDEYNDDHKLKYSWNNWKEDEVIKNNLDWLVEKGFIEEEVKEYDKCPRCKSNMKLITVGNRNNFYLTCSSCLVKTEIYYNKKKLINAWNRRAKK